MNRIAGPLVQRRRLRSQLRRARAWTGHTQDQVAVLMDWSLSKVIRIESRAINISTNGISDRSRADKLVELGQASCQGSWWSRTYRPLISEQYLQYIEYEEAASVLDLYEPLLTPGLLQTPEYTTAIIREHATPGTLAGLIQARIDIRLKRQELLSRDPPPNHRVGPRGGCRPAHCRATKPRPGADSPSHQSGKPPGDYDRNCPLLRGIASQDARAVPDSQFPGSDGDVLFSETSRDTLFSDEDHSEIPGYRNVFSDLRSVSLRADATLRYLQNLASQLSQQNENIQAG